MLLEGPHEPKSWNDFPNDQSLPELVQFKMKKKTGEIITISPMNPAKHSPKAAWVRNPAVYYSIPHVIDEADSEIESVSNTPMAIENGQLGKIMVYSKSGMLNKLDLPDFAGQNIEGDVIEAVVLYNEKTGDNYTLHYDVKINTQ